MGYRHGLQKAVCSETKACRRENLKGMDQSAAKNENCGRYGDDDKRQPEMSFELCGYARIRCYLRDGPALVLLALQAGPRHLRR